MIIKLNSARLLHESNLLLINYNVYHELSGHKDINCLVFYAKDTARLLIEYNRILFCYFTEFFSLKPDESLRTQLVNVITDFVTVLHKYLPSQYVLDTGRGDALCIKCASAAVCLNCDGFNVCLDCGYMHENYEKYFITENFNSDTVNVNKKNQYKESIHYMEVMQYYHGEVKKPLSNEVIALIESEVMLRHKSATPADNYAALTPRDLKGIMKHIKFPNGEKYYNYIPYVYNILTRKQVMNVKDHFDTFMMQFNELLNVWEKYIKNSSARNSFLSSHYVFYQILLKNGFVDESRQVILLKSTEKKREHDELFRKMCAILKWEFTPVAPLESELEKINSESVFVENVSKNLCII